MKKEYTQLELTTTDPKPLFRDLIAAWAEEEAPEGDGYHALIEIYLEIYDNPPRFAGIIYSRLWQTRLAFEKLTGVISVLNHPEKCLEILESLMLEYGISVGNFERLLQERQENGLGENVIYELSHVHNGAFLACYGTPSIPVFRFLFESGEETYFGVHPVYGIPQNFGSSEEALLYSMVGDLHPAVGEIVNYVRSKA